MQLDFGHKWWKGESESERNNTISISTWKGESESERNNTISISKQGGAAIKINRRPQKLSYIIEEFIQPARWER